MSYNSLDYSGYVPFTFPFGGDEDYVEMDICLDCGQIQEWKKVSEKVVLEAFSKG